MIIEASKLKKFYGEFEAIKGIDINIEGGKIGLLGPNGAGKTTLIKVILGLLEFDEGDITVFGRHVKGNERDIRAKIGYMPESDAFLSDMKAIDFVAYMGELSGMPRADAMQRAHEVLYYVGLGEARYRLIKEYSTGMKQRVKLAQALVHDPELIILDEPTNGMDPAGRTDMLNLINNISSFKGKNIIVCSHLLDDIRKVADKVIIMGEGHILASGDIDTFLKKGNNDISVTIKKNDRQFEKEMKNNGLEYVKKGKSLYTVTANSDAEFLAIMSSAARSDTEIRRIQEDIMTLDELYINSIKNMENHEMDNYGKEVDESE